MLRNAKEITKRQKELLSIIYDYIRTTGYPPTFEEMRETLGVSSNQSVIDLLEKLKEGVLIKRNDGARRLTLLPLAYEVLGKPRLVPFLGISSAGSPLEAIEISGEWDVLPGKEGLARLQKEVYILKISGDSMINAGIDNEDTVLVEQRKEFSSQDIVHAQILDESTIKRFISDDTPPYIYLKPENPKYNVIPFTEEMRLLGKVLCVFKNGDWKAVK